MSHTAAAPLRDVHYEPDENPPPGIALGLGFQFAMLSVASIVLTPAIVVRAAGASEDYLSWAAFAALGISGITTVLQAVRVGRVGSGYILLMGTSAAFIAVCVTAIAEGGPGLLATLVTVAAVLQFGLAARLSLLRRVLTPTVCGTVVMLIPVTLIPIMFGLLNDVPEGAPPAAAPFSAAATLLVTVMVALRAAGSWRLWAPVLGIAAGCAVAGAYGVYDIESVAAAAWVGLPEGAWPGFRLDFGITFWSLLPAFIFVTLIGAIETIGDSVAIQRVSYRKPRATDFRVVQGAVAADGVGNLLSGLAATVPNTTYSSSISVTEITGVAARNVGICTGGLFVVLAFLPKFMAVILAIPGPVVSAYLIVLMGTLFVVGMKLVVEDGAGYRKGTVAGVGFWVGLGFQNELIFADALGPLAGLLGNGMTSGGLAAILMTLFLEYARPRRQRLRTGLNMKAHPAIDTFLSEFAASQGWGKAMTERLRAVGEETLLTLLRAEEEDGEERPERHLELAARSDGRAAELEFMAATDDPNIEDEMMLLGERTTGGAVAHRKVSLKLLRHYASSVRHQQYHDTDVVMVRVDQPPESA